MSPRSICRVALAVAAVVVAGCRTSEPDRTNVRLPIPVAEHRRMEAEYALAQGQELARQGMHEQALAEFTRAIEINPELGGAHIGVGGVYEAQGDYEAAERAYARAARVEPRNFDAHYRQGLMLQLLNRITEAIRAYVRALTIRPDDFDANLNLATAYLQLGEAGQALVYGERAVRLRGDSAAARVNLGAIYAALNRHADAVTEFQQAAELMELTPELLLNLADSLGRIGRHAEMASTLEQLIAIEPSAAAWERMGKAQFRMRNFDEALAAFRTALEYDADYYPALNGVGVCLLNTYIAGGKTDMPVHAEAVAALRRSLQIERRQPKVVEILSRYD